ncbi:FAD-binding oxidoreductase [Arthrobacter woluwensis]|uniref:FAD-binding oxidoreductase n=1 Tax=Arthrobacter woluwensis TaxID=156980 RepID=UPI000D135EE6|nr:FAD-binding oxidoreductase [Arthrobacter woluwensis]PSS43257.1 FAD-binding oxidoreductase [Arthrobacter woluwensis]
MHEIAATLTQLLGPDKVATDPVLVREYSQDRAPDRPEAPALAVVFAGSAEDVQATVRACAAAGVRVVPRGAGSGLSGGAHAVKDSVIISLERMNRILDVRAEDEVAVVEPGVVNADLNAAAAEHGLMYAPDPASFTFATIGGNIGTNAGGLRCAKYGVTRDSVLALDVVLADGELVRLGHATFKGVAGYDLVALLVGSEGTLGIVVGATVRLRHLPVKVVTIAAFFPDLPSAAAGVLAVGRARVQPAIMELMDRASIEDADALNGTAFASRGSALLLVQTDGFGADAEAAVVREVLRAAGGALADDGDSDAERFVLIRRNNRGAGAEDRLRVGEDVAVPRSLLVDYAAELERIAAEYRVGMKLVAHAGDGNLHPTFWAEPQPGEEEAAVADLDQALDDSVRVALAMGGTITGEHGIGSFKLRWLGWEQSERVRELQRGIKDVFDPHGVLNPGKAI